MKRIIAKIIIGCGGIGLFFMIVICIIEIQKFWILALTTAILIFAGYLLGATKD